MNVIGFVRMCFIVVVRYLVEMVGRRMRRKAAVVFSSYDFSIFFVFVSCLFVSSEIAAKL